MIIVSDVFDNPGDAWADFHKKHDDAVMAAPGFRSHPELQINKKAFCGEIDYRIRARLLPTKGVKDENCN